MSIRIEGKTSAIVGNFYIHDISIKDLFAMYALNGLVSKCPTNTTGNRKKVAEKAYKIADEMMKLKVNK